MGPDNPWSANWRPDPSGRRLAAIRAARIGAVVAGILYAVVGAVVVLLGPLPRDVAVLAVTVGLPGVALLGAGLAPAAARGARIDAVVVGIAMAIGAPVAAVTSCVVGGFVLDAFFDIDVAGAILRGSVLAAIGVAPLVGLAAAAWVVVIRRLAPMSVSPA